VTTPTPRWSSPSRHSRSTVAEVVLASASPRRLELLRLAGLEPLVCPADIDETPHPGEPAIQYVRRLAAQKVRAVAGETGQAVVVAADTAVVLDGELLGKPADAEDAAVMLRRLAGVTHHVSTGVAVIGADATLRQTVVTTGVTMTPLDDRTIAAYVATGEPLDKAGGYGIQGRAGAFVAAISGSYTNVVGLPLAETLALLRSAGWDDS
jgi:septum formation protein